MNKYTKIPFEPLLVSQKETLMNNISRKSPDKGQVISE